MCRSDAPPGSESAVLSVGVGAVDRVGADLVLHGHAHRGSRDGTTPGGVPVRNVAAPVIGRAYEVFRFAAEDASA